VNGRLSADGLQGRTELSAVNGRIEVQFERLGDSAVELRDVNGAIDLTLPSDANAELEASTVSGDIDNDFGLHANHHRWVGHNMHGALGSGETRIKLSDVNGRIEVRHANDGRPLSSVKDLNRHEDGDRDDEE